MKTKHILFSLFSSAMLASLLLIAAFSWNTAVPAQAAGNDWYANPTIGNDNNNCTTVSTPCKTVLGVVNKAASGDTVHLAAGTYNEDSVWIDKSLTVTGEGSATTIISGNGEQTVIFFQNSGGVSNILLEDVTVRNGGNTGLVNQGASVTLRRLIVENHSSTFTGGGIENSSSGSMRVESSLLRANNAGSGGSALINFNGTVVISNTAVINNRSSTSVLHNQGDMTLINVTVSGNDGDGVAQPAGSTITAVNVTIANNRGYGITNYGTFNVKNSILANNTAGNCATGGSTVPPVSQGYNIDSAGLCGFIATGDKSNANPALFPLMAYNGTWLHAFAPNSPARDQGTNSGCPADDQSGTSRPKNRTCDIGAFEYDPANPPKMKVYLPVVVRP